MIATAAAQHWPYKGHPLRSWMRVQFVSGDGSWESVDLIADTGSPCAIVVGIERLRRSRAAGAASLSSNFGNLEGGWLRLVVPGTSFDDYVKGYGSDSVAEAATRSHADFGGLIGLPLLRLLGFGGDEEGFWIG